MALTTAAGAMSSAAIVLLVSLQTLDVRSGIALRALLVTLALLLGTWWAVRTRALGSTRRQLRLSAFAGLLVGYAACPTTWGGTLAVSNAESFIVG